MKLSQQTIDMLKEQGYSDLDDYLMSLSTDYGVPVNWVVSLAEISGENELNALRESIDLNASPTGLML